MLPLRLLPLVNGHHINNVTIHLLLYLLPSCIDQWQSDFRYMTYIPTVQYSILQLAPHAVLRSDFTKLVDRNSECVLIQWQYLIECV